MRFNDTLISLDVKTPIDYLSIIAGNVKARRLELNLTQEGVASRAGLKLPTYRKFERTGEISLTNLLKIAWCLDMLDDFDNLFVRKKYASIDEVISGNSPQRKRGKRK